jgi:DNA-directed RNA polymerase specialized sigma24 family protein
MQGRYAQNIPLDPRIAKACSETFRNRHLGCLKRAAKRHESALAEDAFQESCLVLLRVCGTAYESRAPTLNALDAWFATTSARKLWRLQKRQRQGEARLLDQANDGFDWLREPLSTIDVVAQREFLTSLRCVITKLPKVIESLHLSAIERRVFDIILETLNTDRERKIRIDEAGLARSTFYYNAHGVYKKIAHWLESTPPNIQG